MALSYKASAELSSGMATPLPIRPDRRHPAGAAKTCPPNKRDRLNFLNLTKLQS